MTAPNPAAVAAMTIAVGEARAASFTLANGLRLALVLGVAVADVPAMHRAGVTWSREVGMELVQIQTDLNGALGKARSGWTADDLAALEEKLEGIGRELANVQRTAGLVSGGVFAVAGAYALFWAYAAVVASLSLALAAMVLAAQFTPVGPAMRISAETIVGSLVTVLDAWLAKLAAVTTAAGGLAGAVATGTVAAWGLANVDSRTASLEQVEITWAPPNRFVSPRKEEPVSYEEAVAQEQQGD